MGTEYLIKVGSRYPDIGDPRHFSHWRDGQIIDVREQGFHQDKKSRFHHCIIELPDVDYWAERGSTDWKSDLPSVFEMKKLVSTPESDGKFLWELPPDYIRTEDPLYKRPYFIDLMWLLIHGYIDIGQYESAYDKTIEQKPIILPGIGLYDILKIEGVDVRLSPEKDQTGGTISSGTYSIGAAGDYATVTAFEADLAATLTGNLTGEHLNEETTISAPVIFDIDTGSYLLTLTAQSGAEHNGGAYGNGARINYGTYDDLEVNSANTDMTFSNLAIDCSGGSNNGIFIKDCGNIIIESNLIKGGGGNLYNIQIRYEANDNPTLTYNNILYDAGTAGIIINVQYNSGHVHDCYNNTVIGCAIGIDVPYAGTATITVKDNLCQGNTVDYDPTGIDTSSKNVSEDATSPDVAYRSLNCHDGNSCFVNYGSDDFRLTAGGDELGTLDDGDDLSGTFTDDIIGTVRSTWYIGAYELAAAGVTVSPDAINAIAGKVDPTVALGSTSVSPTALSSIVDTINPTVIKGSIAISPSVLTAIALSIDPTVQAGGVTVAPSPSNSIASSVNPTVVLGSVTIIPTSITAIVDSIAPSVVISGVIITPDPSIALVSSVNPTVVLGSTTASPSAISVIALTVGASVPESDTALRFNYDSTYVDFRMDELRRVEVEHIQKSDQFWDQDNKFHQYLVGKLYRKIRIIFRQDDADTYGKIETIWNQVDTYNQPSKITLYYRFKIDSDSLLVQMDRSAFEKKYYKHSRSARDVETIFIETES